MEGRCAPKVEVGVCYHPGQVTSHAQCWPIRRTTRRELTFPRSAVS